MEATKPKSSQVEKILIAASVILQSAAAVIGIIEYVTARFSTIVGAAIVYQIIVGISGLVILTGISLLTIRAKTLTDQQRQNIQVTLFLAVAVILFFGGLWIGEKRAETSNSLLPPVVVEPISQDETPLLLMKSFDFEGSVDGWSLSEDGAPTTFTIESDPEEAYRGNRYLVLRTNLPGTQAGETIKLEQTIYLLYGELEWTRLVETVIAFVKVVPSDQTTDNEFIGEIQVHASTDDQDYWSKTRYPLTPGKWTPLMWNKPTWLTNNEQEIFFPDSPTDVNIMIWSKKPFIGSIEVDDVGFYLVKRP